MVRQESCPEDTAAPSGNTEIPGTRPLHIFLQAILPPIVIFALNEWAIGYGNLTHWQWSARTILYALYVVQVALLSLYLGRYLRSWFLRWTILIWVLAAVPVLTLGQHIDPMAIGFLAAIGVWSRMLFTAACLSIVPLVVVLTVFSRKRTLLMAVGSLILLAILGFYMSASLSQDPTGYGQRSWQLWIISDLSEVGFWWIGWHLLSAAFLAALLLMLRSAGYRLENRWQPRSPFAENAN